MNKQIATIGIFLIVIGAVVAFIRISGSKPVDKAQKRDLQRSTSAEQSPSARGDLKQRDDVQRKYDEKTDTGEVLIKNHAQDGQAKEVNPENAEKQVKEPSLDKDNTISVIESRDIKVFNPTPDQVLTSPFVVKGEARVDSVHIRVTDQNGKTLIKETVPVRSDGEWGTFSWTITYEFQSTKKGFVEVYSLKGNKEMNLIKIFVSFN